MATAWNAWPTPPLSRSPSKYSRSPTSPLSVSPTAPSLIDRSYLLSQRLAAATPPLPERDLPILPPEILRRIIRAALALDPSIPDPIPLDYPARSAVPSALPSPGITSSFPSGPSSYPFPRNFPTYAPTFPGFDEEEHETKDDNQVPVEWDVFAGRSARRQHERRVQKRCDVARTARAMMGVCRAWKVGTARCCHRQLALTLTLSRSDLTRSSSRCACFSSSVACARTRLSIRPPMRAPHHVIAHSPKTCYLWDDDNRPS